ncbi:helix-turn-helix domain-containing protein [Paenibacillus sp. MBLB4367]|uniref:AraC family transcriptional regulator n=1 Tax=Paenibacillus sp. MBLB4367 TaxID=3384767 RepID=UPI003907F1AC
MEKKSMNLYAYPGDFPFWIQRNRHDIRDMPGMHTHEFVELIYVTEGRATHLFQDISYEIRAGDVFVINPGEMHGYAGEPDQHIEIVNCLFEPGFIQTSLLRELNISDSLDFFYVQPFFQKETRFHHKLNLRGTEAADIMDILEHIHAEMGRRRPGFRPLIQLKMIELFILLSRYYNERKTNAGSVPPGELLVLRVCGYVDRHYNEKLTLPLFSELFHIGVRQLNRYFNRYVGCSVIEYVHRIRMEKAKRLLAETGEKIVVVAEMVGYEDPAFFSKLFTRTVGFSPGKYREANR